MLRLANSSGIGHSPSVVQSLVAAGLTTDYFSMCLGDSGGSLAFGADVEPPNGTVFTRMIGQEYFSVSQP